MQLPAGERAIDSKWIYKVKYKINREIESYKVGLLAKGFYPNGGSRLS